MHHIGTFNFLEVVQQHILGVVGNVTHCFVRKCNKLSSSEKL